MSIERTAAFTRMGIAALLVRQLFCRLGRKGSWAIAGEDHILNCKSRTVEVSPRPLRNFDASVVASLGETTKKLLGWTCTCPKQLEVSARTTRAPLKSCGSYPICRFTILFLYLRGFGVLIPDSPRNQTMMTVPALWIMT